MTKLHLETSSLFTKMSTKWPNYTWKTVQKFKFCGQNGQITLRKQFTFEQKCHRIVVFFTSDSNAFISKKCIKIAKIYIVFSTVFA